MSKLKLGDLIQRDLVHTDPSTSIKDCILHMEQENIGCLFISDDDQSSPGIFTERDVLRIVAQGLDLSSPVSEVMSTDLISASVESDLKEVFSTMIDNLFRHMPITDETGKFVAVVSLRAICQKIRELMG